MRRRARLSSFSSREESHANDALIDPKHSPTHANAQVQARNQPHTHITPPSGLTPPRPDADQWSAPANGPNENTVETRQLGPNRSSSPTQRKSATIPFGLALQSRRSSQGSIVVTPTHQSTRNDSNDARAAAHAETQPMSPSNGSTELRERIAAARASTRPSTRELMQNTVTERPIRENKSIAPDTRELPQQKQDNQRKSSKLTMEMLMDPLMSEDDQSSLLRAFGQNIKLEEEKKVDLNNQIQTSSVHVSPVQAKGVQRRELRAQKAAAANADAAASTSAPVAEKAHSRVSVDAQSDASLDANRAVEPRKRARTHSADKIKQLLQGYFCVARSQWNLLGEGSQIRYFVAEDKPREERYRNGGYIRSVAGDKIRVHNYPGSGNSWVIDLNGIAEIWKRFCPIAAVEISIIHNMLKEQQKQLDQQQKTIEELQNIVSLNNHR